MLGLLTTILILAAIAGLLNIMFVGSIEIACVLIGVALFVIASLIVSIRRNEL